MHDLFGRDMTTMGYTCTNCGSTGVVAEMVVYMSGPGTVARCRECDAVLLMLTERHGMYCIDMPAMPKTVSPPGLTPAVRYRIASNLSSKGD